MEEEGNWEKREKKEERVLGDKDWEIEVSSLEQCSQTVSNQTIS